MNLHDFNLIAETRPFCEGKLYEIEVTTESQSLNTVKSPFLGEYISHVIMSGSEYAMISFFVMKHGKFQRLVRLNSNDIFSICEPTEKLLLDSGVKAGIEMSIPKGERED